MEMSYEGALREVTLAHHAMLHSGAWAGLRLKGRGGDRGNSRAVVERSQGM